MEESLQYSCKTPVVFIVFNRPLETETTLLAIKKVKPDQLFIVADGPRQWVPEDSKNVRKCRDLIICY